MHSLIPAARQRSIRSIRSIWTLSVLPSHHFPIWFEVMVRMDHMDRSTLLYKCGPRPNREMAPTHRRQQCPRSVPLPPDPNIIRHDRPPGRHASIPKIQLAAVTLQHQRICSPNARFPSQSICRPGARSWRCAAPCWHREVLAPDGLAKAGNAVPHRMPRELDLPVSG